MRIGKLNLDSKAFLAPMAGVNCAAFRLICREYGAGLVYSPMLVFNQIIANPDDIIARTCFLKKEKPISIQLVGNDSKEARQAAELIEPYADIIDINFGCPDNNILALKAGSFFAKHPEQMKKVITPIISSTNKPVTAKIRTGWDEKTVNTVKTVKILEDLGVDAIAIHGRTTKQKYTGKADWKEIKAAKEAANIPIIGNGDIFMPGNAKVMIEQTGCDFIMVGRGAIGNPFIFKRINSLLKTGKNIKEPTDKEKLDCFRKFLTYYKRYEKMRAFTELRQHAMWFTKGVRGSRKMRQGIMKCDNVGDILEYFS